MKCTCVSIKPGKTVFPARLNTRVCGSHKRADLAVAAHGEDPAVANRNGPCPATRRGSRHGNHIRIPDDHLCNHSACSPWHGLVTPGPGFTETDANALLLSVVLKRHLVTFAPDA